MVKNIEAARFGAASGITSGLVESQEYSSDSTERQPELTADALERVPFAGTGHDHEVPLTLLDHFRPKSGTCPGCIIGEPPGVGIPLGAYAIRRMDAETFRRLCMSFDVWVVGFGLSRTLIDLKLAAGPLAYGAMLAAILLDLSLLFAFLRSRRSALAAA